MSDAPGHVLVAFLDGPWAGQTQQLACDQSGTPAVTVQAYGWVYLVGPAGTHRRAVLGTYIRSVSQVPPGGSFRTPVRWTFRWFGEPGLEPEWPDDPSLFTT